VRGASWAYPKAEDHGSNIAGQGPCIAAKAATQCPLWGFTSRPTSEQGICACGCLLSSRRFGGERFFKSDGGTHERSSTGSVCESYFVADGTSCVKEQWLSGGCKESGASCHSAGPRSGGVASHW